jgi:hypothetical protein
VLLAVALSQPQGNENDGPDDNLNTGSLVITIVNPHFLGAEPCNYTLSINNQLESNGTIPAGGSDVFERDFTWSGPELAIQVHVEVPGTATPSEDRTVTLTPGETERLTIILNTWLVS